MAGRDRNADSAASFLAAYQSSHLTAFLSQSGLIVAQIRIEESSISVS